VGKSLLNKSGRGKFPASSLIVVATIVALVLLLGKVTGASFASLPQQLVNGIMLGAIYALVALGYTMVYGVLRLINFAHGEVFMIGAYTALFCAWSMGYTSDSSLEASSPWNLLLMLCASMLVCGLLGVLIEILAYRPMRNQPRIASLITAIGVSLLMQHGGALFLPVSPPPSINEKVNPFRTTIERTLVHPAPEVTQRLAEAEKKAKEARAALDEAKKNNVSGDELAALRAADRVAMNEEREAYNEVETKSVKIRFPQGQGIMLLTTIVLMVLLTYLVLFTKVGRAMRAVSHDFDSASLMGINVSRIVTLTFFIGSALAGAGAMMNATFLGTSLTAQYGVLPGVKAFVAAVLGGIGNIPGAVLGGLLMGMAETLIVWIGLAGYRDAIAFVILIVILLLKPGGLLGSAKVEKV
jgi:branched-chain amino acid transport system permease protein